MDGDGAPLLWSRGRHLLDAARTLVDAGDARAEEAVHTITSTFDSSPFRLISMEAGLLAGRIGANPQLEVDAKQIIDRLDHDLGSPEGFRSRWFNK